MDENTLRLFDFNSAPEFSLCGMKCLAKVVSLYDADTCNIIIYMEGHGYRRFNCRLINIDAPEMRPSLDKPDRALEKRAAIIARNRLLELITRSTVHPETKHKKSDIDRMLADNKNLVFVHFHGSDKYGRQLIEIFDERDRACSYNNTLIGSGYACEYHGGTKISFNEYFKH